MRADASAPMPSNKYEFLVASCHISRHYLSGSKEFRACTRDFISGPLMIRYLFDESNVRLVSAMDAFLVKKTREWLDCSTPKD